jgi:ABC-type transport system involved in cytochrome c biogenesis ATPase subunit
MTPKMNDKITMLFRSSGKGSVVSTGIGKTRMARSVAMLMGAEDSRVFWMEMQLKFLMSRLYAACTGLQWKAVMKVRITPPIDTTARVT